MTESPWNDIATPPLGDRVRFYTRMAEGTALIPVYWGKDSEGHRLLIVELNGNHSDFYIKHRVPLNRIKMDLLQSDSDKQQLVLTLERTVDSDLFLGLCNTLIKNLKSASDSKAGISIALTHIRRWKTFLSAHQKKLLSPEEVRGLFAELSFLRQAYSEFINKKHALEAWCGIEGTHQDFIFGDCAVEIKSLSGRERNTVRISSEDQLEALDDLFLVIFRLNSQSESADARSLNMMIMQMEDEVSEDDLLEIFQRKLSDYGYAPFEEYDSPRFLITEVQAYQVQSEFPRLMRSSIPDGIARVSYEIQLEKITPYRCDLTQIFSR